MLATARLLALGARRLGQPVVVAEMTAGIVLGPSVLGWVAPRASAALFPASSLSLLGPVSDLGLVLFMFLVGLELDPLLLRGRTRAAVLASPAAVVLPFGLGCATAWWLRPLVAPAAPPLAFMLFVGAAMSITAFPVLARILVERRLLRTGVGAMAIACAAGVDVLAWCVVAFALVAARVAGTGAWEAVATTALAAAFVAVMLLVVRPLLARVAERARPAGEGVVALALVGLLVASWITERVGVGAVFGAFLFGAVVPKARGLARHLAEKLEDLVLLLLVPLFFAVSGLRTQIRLLDGPEAWELCAVVVVVGCVGKIAGSALAARVAGLAWREAGALGVLMNTRGLMALIVLNIGLDRGILPPSLFTMLIVMALVTTLIATPLLDVVFPRRLADAEVLAATSAPRAPTPDPSPAVAATTIVLACVDAAATDDEVAAALADACACATSARVWLVRLVAPTERASFVLDALDEAESEEALSAHVDRARAEGHDVRALSFVTARPAHDVCDLAAVKAAAHVFVAAAGDLAERVAAASGGRLRRAGHGEGASVRLDRVAGAAQTSEPADVAGAAVEA